MPYSKPSDAPDWVAADKKKQWVEVWNSVYAAKKKAGMSDKEAEGEAFKQAGGVVKEKKELTMAHREYRYVASELRAESQGDEMAIAGYAALFNSESKDLGGFKEKIAPGAFTRSLQQGDAVYCLFNHDSSRVLGSTKNGTLKLTTDEHGLKFRCIINPKDAEAVATHARIERGDINECSFAFTVNKDGQQWQEMNGNEDFFAMRTLTDVNLLDVSAVTYPAYGGTSVGARSLFPDGIPM
jgi:hypothetical protein